MLGFVYHKVTFAVGSYHCASKRLLLVVLKFAHSFIHSFISLYDTPQQTVAAIRKSAAYSITLFIIIQ